MDRPILFSAPMVCAILAGSKTQTRRVVKPQPPADTTIEAGMYYESLVDRVGLQFPSSAEVFGASSLDGEWAVKCPYGQPGDRLWVRETWGVVSNDWDDSGKLIDWTPDRTATAINEMPFGQGYYSGHVIYAADGSYEWAGDDDGGGEPRSAWHPSIHMPRAASRILLEIVSVRVERLNDISEADARAEGITDGGCTECGNPEPCGCSMPSPSAIDAYCHLWDSINGPGSWNSRPWVWVIEFKRVT